MFAKLLKDSALRNLFFTYIFALVMILMLHAALTTLSNRNYEKSARILANQIEENIFHKEKDNIGESLLSFVKNYPATRIAFFDHEGKKIVATNDNEIRNNFDTHVMDAIAMKFLPKNFYTLQDALKGIQYSEVIWSASLNNNTKHHSFVKVLTPILDQNSSTPNKVEGCLEIYFDVTSEWTMYDNTRYFGLLLISIVFFIFILILNKTRKA